MGSHTQKHPFSFLSYNIYCLPWLATTFSPSSCPLPIERAKGFLPHIESYDIISLQEIWSPRYSIIEQYAKQHNRHVVGSSAPSVLSFCLSLSAFGGGLMIISKYPIVATKEIVYEKGTHSDRFVNKGALYAKVQVKGSYIHVFNTHLQASYGFEFDPINNPYSGLRSRQLRQLTTFIESVTANDEFPIMVMGDFNVNARFAPDNGEDSQEYIDMMKILKSEFYEIVDLHRDGNGGSHPITYDGNGVLHGERPKVGGQRLDFIFACKKKSTHLNSLETKIERFKISGQSHTHLSDHYAQLATVEISEEVAHLSKASVMLSYENGIS